MRAIAAPPAKSEAAPDVAGADVETRLLGFSPYSLDNFDAIARFKPGCCKHGGDTVGTVWV